MAQNHSPFSGWNVSSQGQPPQLLMSLRPVPQELPSTLHYGPQRLSTSSSSITEAGSEEKNRDYEYDGDIVCEQEERGRRGAKGKRKQRDDSPSGVGSRGPSSKKKKGPIYACPYSKHDYLKYHECAGWNTHETHRVKEHCKRFHLKPLLCYNCGKYRTGDQGQLRAHTVRCKIRPSEISPIPPEDVIKASALDVRGLNWSQMYENLFPGEKIPSPIWEEGIVPRTFSEPQVHPPFIPEIWLVDYTRYLQIELKIMPHVMESLRRGYLNMLNLQPYGQPLPLRATLAEDDGTDAGYEYDNNQIPIHHSVSQPSNIPGTYHSYITNPQSLSDELCDGSSSSQYSHQNTIPTNADGTLSTLSERQHQFQQEDRRDSNYGFTE